MANVIFKQGLASEYAALATKDFSTFYRTTDTNELYWGSKKITNAADLEALITRLDGDENTLNSIRNVVAGYISGLDTVSDVTIASQSGKAISIAAGISESDGVIGAGSGTAITLADVASTGAAEDIATAAITDGAAENPQTLYAAGDAQSVLESIARDLNDVTSASVVTVEKLSTATDGYLSSYVVKQNGIQVGATIDIPKDFLIVDATVEVVETADVPYEGAVVGEKYIDFEVNVKSGTATSTHLYIPVNDLVHPLSGGTTTVANEYELQVSVSANNEITASLNNIYAQKVQYVPTSATTKLANVSTVKGALDAIDTLIQGMDADLDATGTAQHSGTFVVSGVTQVDGVITAVDSVEVEAAGAAAAAVSALDATANANKTAIDGDTDRTPQNSGVFAIQSLTETDGKLASMTAVEVDPAGAAATAKAEVIGTGTGRSGSGTEQDPYVYADTIKGVKTLIADSVSDVEAVVNDLDSTATIASKSGDIVTLKAGLVQEDGLVTNNSSSDIVLAAVAANGEAGSVSVEDNGGYFTATDVEAVLQSIGAQLTWQAI